MYRPSLILLLALSALAPATVTAQPRESREWKRIRTGELTVVGNAGPSELRRAAAKIEDFRRTIRAVYPGMKLSFAVPTVLVVFRNHGAFLPFRPRDERGKLEENVGGYFSPHADVAYMVLSAGENQNYTVLYHEYAHAILHLNLTRLPTWVDEGMAEFYSTFESRYRDGKSLIGRVVPYRLTTLRAQPLLPLSKMLTQEGSYELMRSSTTVHRFYAQAWALVHYLQLGNNGKRQGQLTTYMRAVNEGRSIEDAFKQAFATTFQGLERELYDYVSRSSFPAALVDPAGGVAADTLVVEPMSEADARYLQGDLFAKMGSTEDADEEITKALTAEPSHADARIVRAEVRLKQGKTDEAISLLQDVVAAQPSSFRGHYSLAAAFLEAKRYDDALRAAQRAATLNDRSPSAWFAVSETTLAVGREAESSAALERAASLDSAAGWYRARAYSAYALARHAVVVRDAAAYLSRVGVESDSAPYTAFLASLSYRKLGQPENSQKVLTQIEGAIMPASWTEQVLLFLQGKSNADQFLRKARTRGEQTEAHAYIGILLSIAGDRAGAAEHLRWVKERGSTNYVEHGLSLAELEQLPPANR
jgi:tetratricopeptide (TPR) repeat protein